MVNLVVYLCSLSEWRRRLVEAGLALCGPQHCRVLKNLIAGEVSAVLKPSTCTQAEVIYFHRLNQLLYCHIFLYIILNKLDFFGLYLWWCDVCSITAAAFCCSFSKRELTPTLLAWCCPCTFFSVGLCKFQIQKRVRLSVLLILSQYFCTVQTTHALTILRDGYVGMSSHTTVCILIL